MCGAQGQCLAPLPYCWKDQDGPIIGIGSNPRRTRYRAQQGKLVWVTSFVTELM